MRDLLLLNQKRFALNLTWVISSKGYAAKDSAEILKANYGVFIKKPIAGVGIKSQKGAYALAGFLALKLKRGIFITDKIKQDSQLGQRFWVCAFDDKYPVMQVTGDNHARLTNDTILTQSALKQFLAGGFTDDEDKPALAAEQTSAQSIVFRFLRSLPFLPFSLFNLKKKHQCAANNNTLPLFTDITEGLSAQLGIHEATPVDLKEITKARIPSRFKIRYLKNTVAKILLLVCVSSLAIWAANAGFEWWINQTPQVAHTPIIEAPQIDTGEKVLTEIQAHNAYHQLTTIDHKLKSIPLTAKGWNIEGIEYVFLLPNQLRLTYQAGLGGTIETAKALVNLLDEGKGSVTIAFFEQNKKCDIVLPFLPIVLPDDLAHQALPNKKTIRQTITPEYGLALLSQLQSRQINYQLARKTPVSLGDHREHFAQAIHFGALKPLNLAQITQIAKGFDNFVLRELKGNFDQNFTLGWQLTGDYYV